MEKYVCRILIIMFICFSLMGIGLELYETKIQDFFATKYANRKMEEIDAVIKEYITKKMEEMEKEEK